MNTMMFQRHIDYSYWAREQVWQVVLLLSDEQFSQPLTYSVGSIHQQVIHAMWAEATWLSRIQGNGTIPPYPLADYPTRDAIWAQWQWIENDWRTYGSTLTDAELMRQFEFSTTSGTKVVEVVWEMILHVVNHATDHRAQILAMIHTFGINGVEQDWLFYTRKLR